MLRPLCSLRLSPAGRFQTALDIAAGSGQVGLRSHQRGAMAEATIAAPSARELIEAIQEGDRTSLQRLYGLEARRLYGIALRIVRRPDMAADVVQDVFIQVWRNARSFSAERGDAQAWLTGIARYRALDALRKRRREILSDDPALGDAAEEPDIIDRIEQAGTESALRKCLDELAERERRCVVLAFVDGLSHSELARRLGAPLGSVKSWVRRGLLSLRRCLEP